MKLSLPQRAGQVLTGLLMLTVCTVAQASYHEGCTPGYWKNHLDSWVVYTPGDLVGDVFNVPYPDLADDTLLEALDYGGGSGLEGAARILLRHAVAGLLNGVHPNVAFKFDEATTIYKVNNILSRYNRDAMIWQGGFFEAFNEMGCPL